MAKQRPAHERALISSFHQQRRMRVAATTEQGASMLSLIIGILIICVVGAICFWVIDKFVNESRLAGLLKLLVGLVCLAAILQRLLPLAGINWL
ncbi:MAG: hypothetical protein QHD01_13705 [Bradyrhizobium sp.]|uniref:hypothetical protein n=2 Tax=unclassified Bradyrhizobium TaxID=2631580 RepID=UPI0029A000BB|nr:hypothetical protein [Bradyrhizobium sp.]MDX3967644.1 hypothetical protein [Bradyrhizobium sp.]